MLIKCLGSSSSGNSYVLETDTEALIIDCGVPFKEAKVALNFNVSKIVGAVVSHEHLDHLRYADQYIKSGIPVFKPFESDKKTVKFGSFKIQVFDLVHDVQNYGFLITESDNKIVYATDTEYIKYKFKDVGTFLIEANYDSETAEVNDIISDHVYRGHMSIQTAVEFLRANQSESMKDIILCHLSANNADADKFMEMLNEFDCKKHIAHKGLATEIGV